MADNKYIFVNPKTGNREIWMECPDSYMTVDEWEKAHPAPEPKALTDAEKAEAARAERAARRAQIDAESIPLIRAALLGDKDAAVELAEMQKEYDAVLAEEK